MGLQLEKFNKILADLWGRIEFKGFHAFCILMVLTPPLPTNASDNEQQLTLLDSHLEGYFDRDRLDPKEKPSEKYSDLRGWDYLFDIMVRRGADEEEISQILSDKRMPKYKNLYFSVDPKESKASYRRRLKKSEIKNAMGFYKKHQRSFKLAESSFQVPEGIILAIIQIETRCGVFTGNSRIFPKIAKLAAAAEPENIQKNFSKLRRRDRDMTISRVAKRAAWLERTFLPHLMASLVIAEQRDTEVLEVRGSYSGAIGLPQFLPGNQLTYGIDGNFDGKVDLFEPNDAIPSAANFLKSNGWHTMEPTREEQEGVIWNYNRSQPYVVTVLEMADRLTKAIHDYENPPPPAEDEGEELEDEG